MKIALVTIIENNDNLHIAGERAENFRPDRMEDEAVLCFESWRKNGGALKDIPIYAFCPTDRPPSQETIDKLEKLNVTYIHEVLPETKKYTCGFWNVPIGCAWLEENLTEDIFIHTDLDMYLLKPLKEEVFACEKDVLARIGTLSGKRFTRTIEEYPYNFETCFINSWRENRFYKKWYDLLKEMEPELASRKGIVYSEIEEHIVDWMHFDGGYKIEPIKYDFQFGSWYPINHIDNIDSVYFRHEHISGDANQFSKEVELKNYITRKMEKLSLQV